MPKSITLYTARTLSTKWEQRYDDASDRIDKLKEKVKTTKKPDDQMAIEAEMQELYIQANLIHQFLADLGPMVYVEDHKKAGQNV